MPSLEPDEIDQMRRRSLKCHRCKEAMSENYCRECDEFFWICGCKRTPAETHENHRTY